VTDEEDATVPKVPRVSPQRVSVFDLPRAGELRTVQLWLSRAARQVVERVAMAVSGDHARHALRAMDGLLETQTELAGGDRALGGAVPGALMVAAYYNEIDPFAAAWLRELIKAGLIADGEVDERSIELVRPEDVRGFTQCHFFAGIGGWSYAFRLAGWPDTRPVWSGSCPCQPFSQAGFEVGLEDPRDLWPTWYRLLEQLRPAVVFGEQVAAAVAHGWVDRLCDDVERIDYAVGTICFPAASVGTPGIRQRLWFVADAPGARPWPASAHGDASDEAWGRAESGRKGVGVAGWLANADRPLSSYQQLQRSWRLVQPASDPLAGVWAGADWLRCDDGKARPVEPGTFPLAHGLPNRVVKLRGYGNAIVPAAAAAFIEAYLAL
jgi:DNA (cytosine-5)-methyltransferase 1